MAFQCDGCGKDSPGTAATVARFDGRCRCHNRSRHQFCSVACLEAGQPGTVIRRAPRPRLTSRLTRLFKLD